MVSPFHTRASPSHPYSLLFQTSGMDVLDEKLNGAPPMEIDDLVSVKDRE